MTEYQKKKIEDKKVSEIRIGKMRKFRNRK